MALGFSGEVATLYAAYRHGYPTATVERIIDAFCLDTDSAVLDLGCGTGQLARPLASRVGTVVAVDPEPDMLAVARRGEVDNVVWTLGSDRSLPALGRLLGDGRLGAITIAQALHWMDHGAVFAAARPMLRDGGGIAILANGIPLWLHDSDWSQSVREFLAGWLGKSVGARCGTDRATQARYAQALRRAGYAVTEATDESTVELGFDALAGGLLSTFGESRLPHGPDRERFRAGLRDAVGDAESFTEPVPVVTIIGRR